MRYWIEENQIWQEYSNRKRTLLSLLESGMGFSNSPDAKQQETQYASKKIWADMAFTQTERKKTLRIAIAGAGGKTTLLMTLRDECEAAGKKAVVTTTTHMFLPETEYVAEAAGAAQATVTAEAAETAQAAGAVEAAGTTQAAETAEAGRTAKAIGTAEAAETAEAAVTAKVQARSGGGSRNLDIEIHGIRYLGTPVLPEIRQDGWIKCAAPKAAALERYEKTADVVLTEADGSRRMPIKIPAEWEPVIPENTDIILVVYGLSALGQDMEQVCQRARLQEKTGAVSEAFMAEMMRSRYLEPLWRKYPDAALIAVWNQADTLPLLASAKRAVKLCGWPYQLITSQQNA
ncbi:MAG: selenium cofactor biosynthesis protein YqeC [Lachnospiraceae bacterium]|nr:selenium cofactor biosynthesis protein YqeC [Lachnospiraceae bacterium]